MKTLLQQMIEIKDEEERQKWFEELSPEQKEELFCQAKEVIAPVVKFVQDVYIPAVVKVMEAFSKWSQDISQTIEQYRASLSDKELEEKIKDALLKVEQ